MFEVVFVFSTLLTNHNSCPSSAFMSKVFVLQQPDVRLKCVVGLQGLYLEENLSLKMDLFTIRFKVHTQRLPSAMAYEDF